MDNTASTMLSDPDALKKETKVLYADIHQAMILRQRVARQFDHSQPTSKSAHDLSIETKPILIYFLSDLHYSNEYVDYEDFEDIRKKITGLDGAYIITVGDLIDNGGVKIADLGYEDALNPNQQAQALNEILQSFGKQLLLVVSGNHELMSLKSGYEPSTIYMHDIKAHYVRANSHVGLLIGNQFYRGLVAHRGRLRSAFNIHHENVQHRNMMNPVADFVVTGDSHRAGTMVQYSGDGDTRQRWISIKSGTFKVFPEPYSRAYGYASADPAHTCIIFHPDKKWMEPFDDVNEAIARLNYLRSTPKSTSKSSKKS